jgi:predicted ATPase
LLDAVWPDTVVQPEVLSSHIRDLRISLGDNPRQPRFIETLARRGYRFFATVTDDLAAGGEVTSAGQPKLVGRDAELAKLQEYLQIAMGRRRQIVFVTGEPGIGKTALVDEFHRRASAQVVASLRTARGQCIEGYGGHEAYWPLLKAVGEMCRGSGGDSIVRTLATQAPTWLIQFPALLNQEHRNLLQRELLGATRTRMLREISEALATITAATPLLMILEDLQWTDSSSLDFISEITRSRGAAKFMLVITYCPLEATLVNQPVQMLKQDLRVHNLCHEIALRPLEERDIAEYLGAGASGSRNYDGLARDVARRIAGGTGFPRAETNDLP